MHSKTGKYSNGPVPGLIETIRVENGRLMHIDYHNIRFNKSRRDLYGIKDEMKLEQVVVIPDQITAGVYKCRVTYGHGIENVVFEPHKVRHIRSFKLLSAGTLRYNYKFADRSPINHLFAKRGSCDDILMVQNGLITDTSYANIAFWDGHAWLTPAIPLLAGTARARLLHHKELKESAIAPGSLKEHPVKMDCTATVKKPVTLWGPMMPVSRLTAMMGWIAQMIPVMRVAMHV